MCIRDRKTTLTAKEGEFALFLANVDRGTAKKATDWYGLRDLNARDAATIAKYLAQKSVSYTHLDVYKRQGYR